MQILLSSESAAIAEMRPIDRDVMHYLSERTDFESGVIGISRRISYGGIALDLSEREQARRTKSSLFKCTSKQIEKSIDRLVSAGLLTRLSNRGKGSRLILKREKFSDLLNRDRFAKNPEGRVAGRDAGRLVALLKELSCFENNDLENKSIIDGDKEEEQKGMSVGRTSTYQYQHRVDEPFSMTLDWKPSKDELKMILVRAFGVTFSFEKIDKAWTSEFVGYWWANPNKKLTQRQWTSKLGFKLTDYMRQPGLFEKQRGYRMEDEKEQQYVEKNSRSLPQWARPPRDDGALVGWMQANGYGDAPQGYDYQQTRGWLRREIDKRMVDKGLPKIAH